jgi:hypothetical protein
MGPNSARGSGPKKTLWWWRSGPRGRAAKVQTLAEWLRGSTALCRTAGAGAVAEEAGRERAGVAVEDDRRGGEAGAGGELDGGDAAQLHLDPAGRGVVEEGHAEGGRHRFHRAGEAVHPAFDAPHAARFRVPDQREDGGEAKGEPPT